MQGTGRAHTDVGPKGSEAKNERRGRTQEGEGVADESKATTGRDGGLAEEGGVDYRWDPRGGAG